MVAGWPRDRLEFIWTIFEAVLCPGQGTPLRVSFEDWQFAAGWAWQQISCSLEIENS
jgi:hypothetical protein